MHRHIHAHEGEGMIVANWTLPLKATLSFFLAVTIQAVVFLFGQEVQVHLSPQEQLSPVTPTMHSLSAWLMETSQGYRTSSMWSQDILPIM
jgi:hypothetical protein